MIPKMAFFNLLVIVFFIFCAVGCTAEGNFIRTDSTIYPPKPADFDVLVLMSKPQKAYKEIGIVTVHKQATTTLEEIGEDELMPELLDQARAIGADALIDLKFDNYTKSAVFSARTKHALKATATAIIFTK